MYKQSPSATTEAYVPGSNGSLSGLVDHALVAGGVEEAMGVAASSVAAVCVDVGVRLAVTLGIAAGGTGVLVGVSAGAGLLVEITFGVWVVTRAGISVGLATTVGVGSSTRTAVPVGTGDGDDCGGDAGVGSAGGSEDCASEASLTVAFPDAEGKPAMDASIDASASESRDALSGVVIGGSSAAVEA
jgi:hypothetical protein